MKKVQIFAMGILLIALVTNLTAVGQTNKQALKKFAVEKTADYEKKKTEALIFAKANNIPVVFETETAFMQLMYINENGQPQYYITTNADAAATMSTNKVNPGGGAGLNLDGNGMTVHEWDGGAVRASHQEYNGRVTQVDGATSTHYHSTHVAGTLIASGVEAQAKGMAPAANLNAYDWNNDDSEMATAAANGALISNHSYGLKRGWAVGWTGWSWWGDKNISTQEDYLFGFYDDHAKNWDIIAKNAPYYLIVKSAGNERGNGPDDGKYPQDGPYDCIGNSSLAKNIITIGAVEDIPNGYTQPSDVSISYFSSWGPVDDGRIKPDICANGVGLYSTVDDNNSKYRSLSGTSMSSPAAAGSLILLQEHYQDLNGNNNFMLAATLKALVIHTADEAGPDPGPDYMYGWGLMNTESAALKISEDQTLNVMEELTLNNGGTYSRTVTAVGGQPLVATVVWTDVEGSPVSASLDPIDPMIVNQLDLRITEGSNTHFPWSCSIANHSAAATRNGENNVDNVQMVTIDNPTAGTNYTIVVDHDGSLSGGSQNFSIILSGAGASGAQPPVADFTANATSISTSQSVAFSDQSTNTPTSWSWTFEGGTPASSTEQNPTITYNTAGTFDVSLTATNDDGSNTKTSQDYITVTAAACNYCSIYYSNIDDDFISKITFNSIDNSSSSTHYSDFTAMSTDIAKGNTYMLSADITINGTWEQQCIAWVDWNGNCDFTDDGEAFDLGVTSGAAGIETLTVNITVPDDANLGQTRIRIAERYYYDPSSCDDESYGEAEDYTVNIIESSSTGPVELSYSDFESGWGIWADGGGDCKRKETGYSPQGSFSLDIQDNSGVSSSFYHTNGVDIHTLGFVHLKVEFDFQAISMDNSNEDFWVQYFDGSSWNTVADFDYLIDFQNNNIYAATVNIHETDYTFPTNMKIRFMCDASGNRDDVYIDKIRITASDQTMNSNNQVELISEGNMQIFDEPEQSEELIIYPNPIKDGSLTISAPYLIKTVSVYNMMGELITVAKGIENLTYFLNTSSYKAGIYIIRIESDDDAEAIRMVKY